MIKKGKKMDEKILELLYRSFDDKLKEKEQKQLDEALEKSEELRRKKEQIASLRLAVSESSAQTFKPFFAERVMNRIHSLGEKNGLETFYEALKAAFRRFAIIGAFVMVSLIFYNLSTGDSLSTDEVFYASDVTFEEILDLPLF